MHIHKVEEGETLYRIASRYGAPIPKLIESNELSDPDRLVTGEELIVLLPTRTHRVRGTESLSDVGRRYEIKRAELLRNNPSLILRRDVYPGELLAVRYPAPKGGMGASLGYVPRGTARERLLLTLPYLTYFVFEGACESEDGIRYTVEEDLLRLVQSQKKTPLLRVHAKDGETIGAATMERLCALAREGGFYGIVLAKGMLAHLERRQRDAYLVELRRLLLGCDLILFAECDETGEFGDYLDGNIIVGGAINDKDAFFDRVADSYECAKSFLALPSGCLDNGKPISYAKMREIGFKFKAELEIEEDGTQTLRYRRYRFGKGEEHTVRVFSPSYLSTLVGYLCEYGMMGAAIDVRYAPVFALLLLHTSLYEVDYAFSMFDRK